MSSDLREALEAGRRPSSQTPSRRDESAWRSPRSLVLTLAPRTGGAALAARAPQSDRRAYQKENASRSRSTKGRPPRRRNGPGPTTHTGGSDSRFGGPAARTQRAGRPRRSSAGEAAGERSGWPGSPSRRCPRRIHGPRPPAGRGVQPLVARPSVPKAAAGPLRDANPSRAPDLRHQEEGRARECVRRARAARGKVWPRGASVVEIPKGRAKSRTDTTGPREPPGAAVRRRHAVRQSQCRQRPDQGRPSLSTPQGVVAQWMLAAEAPICWPAPLPAAGPHGIPSSCPKDEACHPAGSGAAVGVVRGHWSCTVHGTARPSSTEPLRAGDARRLRWTRHPSGFPLSPPFWAAWTGVAW